MTQEETQTETQVPPPPAVQDLSTPTDEVEPARKEHPTKGRRYAISQDGDVHIFQVAPKDSQFPEGSLLPIPTVPRFQNVKEATRWVENDSGDKLAGKHIVIIYVKEEWRIQVDMKPEVKIIRRQKVQVKGPEMEDE